MASRSRNSRVLKLKNEHKELKARFERAKNQEKDKVSALSWRYWR